MKHIDIYTGNYEITLLSVDEYRKYKDIIPHIKGWWWLRSPGEYQDYAAVVRFATDVDVTGECITNEYTAVRPVLKSGDIHLPAGKQFIALGNRWTVIDEGVAISNEGVSHRMFDKRSNVWEKSELKVWLGRWANEGEVEE